MDGDESPVLAALVGAILIVTVTGVHATPQTTCKAAANIDKHVNYDFCVSELGGHPDSPNADAWGLAKIAALLGVGNADGARADVEDLLAKPGTDDRLKVPLRLCHNLYDQMGMAFADAADEINWRHYDLGKKKVAQAVLLAQQCDNAFAKAGVRSSEDSVQLVVICTVITNLIK
ncbi:unnamed protein product [Alopecurus aequalis]